MDLILWGCSDFKGHGDLSGFKAVRDQGVDASGGGGDQAQLILNRAEMVPWDRCSGHAWLKALSPCWINYGCEQGAGVLGALLGHHPFWTPKGNGRDSG